MNWKTCLLAALAILSINSCINYSKPEIAIIQGMNTDWDEQLDADFKRECHVHQNVNFIFHTNCSDDLDEVKEIEAAVARGVDAIIINPVSASDELVPAIEKAYDSGIYVVIVGQKPYTYKYNAYLGVDNREIGRLAASYVASKMGGEGNLLTVGLADFDAAFYAEREHAFMNTISQYEGIKVTDCPIRAWGSNPAHEAMDSIAAVPGIVRPDMIFAFGDDIALGVLEADIWPGVLVMGVDGTPGTGLAEIRKGNLYASIMNPTRGADAIATAVEIISGGPYEKNDIFVPEIIDINNVSAAIESSKEASQYKHRVDILNQKYDRIYPKMRTMTIVTTVLAMLVLILSAGVLLMGRDLKYGNNLFESLKFSRKELEGRYQTLQTEYEISEASRRSLEEDRKVLLEAVFNTGKNDNIQEFSNPVEESAFLSKLRNYLEENLDNAELSMDDIASSLNLSKTQMYRKVRAVSEMTPNELLQAMRLSKADELLKSSDLTIAEVAYSVGFSSPSYFTRCYKERYGVPPKEKR